MPLKRALSFIFIFLMLSVNFTVMAENVAADDKQLLIYQVNLFDQMGRLLPQNNSAIGANLQSVIYTERKVLGIPVGWQKIGQYSGGQFQFKAPLGEKAKIVVFWYDKEQYDNVFYLSTNEIIDITLPFIPCVPLIDVRAESIGLSSDIHEINTAHYDVKFGQGRDKNEIWITLGTQVHTIPVNLELSGGGSETKPFKFLAQAPNTTVQGTEKFLIWTTGKYISGVHTYKVGDNGLIVVWTYMYADVTGAWTKKIIEGALLGAIAGTIVEPGVGTAIGGLAGGLAAGVAWALKPELVNITAHAAIGVVAGYFTPRWFILQGTSGLGTNSTTGTVSMDLSKSNLPAGLLVDGQSRWDIYTQSNTIQVAYTKYYGTGIFSKYYDFEDQVIPPHEDKTSNNQDAYFSISTSKVYAGEYALKIHNSNTGGALINLSAMHHFIKGDYTITVDTDIYVDAGIIGSINIVYKIGSSTSYTSLTDVGVATFKWVHIVNSWDLSITESNTYVYLEINAGYGSDATYIDNLKIQVFDKNAQRITLDTSGGDEGVIVKRAFGTIPEIAPVKNKPVPLTRKYTMLAVDVSGTDGFIALDWASPQPTVYYSRLYIRTATMKETAWLFFTDDKYGFQDVTFLITEPKNFVYHIDLYRYYALSTPDNWTFTPDWSPTIVNKTMIFLPPEDWNGVTLYNLWDSVSYKFNSWWQNIGTWGHLALYGLGLLILFIILLIFAPWLIFALIKILALILKAIAKLIVAAAKGMGKMMKSFKRRRKG